jgi:hypothetical protein
MARSMVWLRFGAAVTLDRRLAATVLVAYPVFARPHLIFHLHHFGPDPLTRRAP